MCVATDGDGGRGGDKGGSVGGGGDGVEDNGGDNLGESRGWGRGSAGSLVTDGETHVLLTMRNDLHSLCLVDSKGQ